MNDTPVRMIPHNVQRMPAGLRQWKAKVWAARIQSLAAPGDDRNRPPPLLHTPQPTSLRRQVMLDHPQCELQIAGGAARRLNRLVKSMGWRRFASAPPPPGPSVPFTNWVDICGDEFLIQARRERRTYPPWVCEERITKPESKRHAAQRVVPQLTSGRVAPQSQIHFRICSLVAPCPRSTMAQQIPTELVNGTLGNLQILRW